MARVASGGGARQLLGDVHAVEGEVVPCAGETGREGPRASEDRPSRKSPSLAADASLWPPELLAKQGGGAEQAVFRDARTAQRAGSRAPFALLAARRDEGRRE